MFQPSLKYLVERHLQGNLTAEEAQILFERVNDPESQHELNELMNVDEIYWEKFDVDLTAGLMRIEQALQRQVRDGDVAIRPAHRVHFLRKWHWAAAVLILLTAGIYFYMPSKINRKDQAGGAVKPGAGILPGSNKALLTLSDGTVITLDSATEGAIAKQGNASIVKLANGEIKYNINGTEQREMMMNTMSTPKGGQYMLLLPDGTKAWLNAASSITFPAFFVDNQRKIKVTGEVYLEVATDKSKPFIVDVNGEYAVQVLGTSFNINSYADDQQVATTLVDGAIKIIDGEEQVILLPGQQARQIIGSKNIEVGKHANISRELAWKNGLFNFEGVPLRGVMKQLERWYDIRVKYEGEIENVVFKGELYRNLPLADVMDIIKDMGVNFRISGNTVIISD